MKKIDQHKIYILTNNQDEAYIMVRKHYFTLDYLIDMSFKNDANWEKKAPVLSRFCRENSKTLTMERLEVPAELSTQKEVLDYRQKIIQQYHSDGYIVLDEKHYEILEAPADANFGEVLKRLNIQEAIKTFGQNTLIEARKTLTVGEFVELYG